MKLSLIDYLTETDKFEEVVNTYLISKTDNKDKRDKKHKKQLQRIFDPQKWREYLQYASSIN